LTIGSHNAARIARKQPDNRIEEQLALRFDPDAEQHRQQQHRREQQQYRQQQRLLGKQFGLVLCSLEQ
jgi:hypothetical protein